MGVKKEREMKGRGGGGGGKAPPMDLLVCFPARAHLSLMPKAICSPSRPTDTPKRHHLPRLTGAAGGASSRGSPLFRTRARNTPSSDVISEPTSPKVTCAGQIKQARPRVGAGGSSAGRATGAAAMEEMEKARGRQQGRRGPHWLESLGIKKDIVHFLAALRGLRFNVTCFGSFRHGMVDCTSDEEDEDGEEEEQGETGDEEEGGGNVLSKWFVLLEENHKRRDPDGLTRKGRNGGDGEEEEEDESSCAPRPPANALLLMRCRSAPASGWLRREEEDEAKEGEKEKEKENEKEKERLVLMSYAPDFFKMSSEIVKETWVVGSIDPLARSRSCRR